MKEKINTEKNKHGVKRRENKLKTVRHTIADACDAAAAMEEEKEEGERETDIEIDKNRRFLRDIFRTVVTAARTCTRISSTEKPTSRQLFTRIVLTMLLVRPRPETACLR